MQAQSSHSPLFQTGKRPLEYSQNQHSIAIANEPNEIMFISKDLTSSSSFIINKTDKTLSLKLTEEVLARGSNQGNLTLWDTRQSNRVQMQNFYRPGYKFKAIDLSGHIMAAASGSKIVFWDLRKMKQRSQFVDSFYDQITSIQFSKQTITDLYGCSSDGLISKFDLTQSNEQDSLVWAHKILQNPSKLQVSGQTVLIQTQDQIVMTIQNQSLKQRYALNVVDVSSQILNSYLDKQTKIHYFSQNMRYNTVDYWTNGKKVGYVPTNTKIQMLIPVTNKYVLFADEQGNWYRDQVHKGVHHRNTEINEQFMTMEELQNIQAKRQNHTHTSDTGFIISKPTTLKNSNKKFRPV